MVWAHCHSKGQRCGRKTSVEKYIMKMELRGEDAEDRQVWRSIL